MFPIPRAVRFARYAVAAFVVGVGHETFDANLAVQWTPPADDRLERRRRMYDHTACGHGQCVNADRLVGTIRQQTGRLIAAPTVDRFVTTEPASAARTKWPRISRLHALPESYQRFPILEQLRIEFLRDCRFVARIG